MLNRQNRGVKEDLGFGSKVEQESKRRFLNRDGSFNVRRTGLSFTNEFDPYHSLVTMSWSRFWFTITAGYIIVNAVFAGALVSIGPSAVDGTAGGSWIDRFSEAFFFSIQTFTTVGYGHLTPQGTLANIIVAFDALVGLMMFALATGLLFARFSKPTAKLIYSKHALVSPYRGGKGLMFRVVNQRRSQLIDVQARVMLSRDEKTATGSTRQYYMLNLEIDKVTFLPLHWTIVHPIDDQSPLAGAEPDDMIASNTEILILLSAIDDTFSQTVHSRTSYRAEEIQWDQKFESMFVENDEDYITVDIHRLHNYHSVA